MKHDREDDLLAEQLRSVPRDAVLRIDTPNALGCMDTRSIPVGRLCNEAADALGVALPDGVQAVSAPTLTDAQIDVLWEHYGGIGMGLQARQFARAVLNAAGVKEVDAMNGSAVLPAGTGQPVKCSKCGGLNHSPACGVTVGPAPVGMEMAERYIVKADSAPLPTEAESDECDAAFNEYLRRGGPGWRPSYADAFRAAWFESRLNTLAALGVPASGDAQPFRLVQQLVDALCVSRPDVSIETWGQVQDAINAGRLYLTAGVPEPRHETLPRHETFQQGDADASNTPRD